MYKHTVTSIRHMKLKITLFKNYFSWIVFAPSSVILKLLPTIFGSSILHITSFLLAYRITGGDGHLNIDLIPLRVFEGLRKVTSKSSSSESILSILLCANLDHMISRPNYFQQILCVVRLTHFQQLLPVVQLAHFQQPLRAVPLVHFSTTPPCCSTCSTCSEFCGLRLDLNKPPLLQSCRFPMIQSLQ